VNGGIRRRATATNNLTSNWCSKCNGKQPLEEIQLETAVAGGIFGNNRKA
jgi:hypothetical protein